MIPEPLDHTTQTMEYTFEAHRAELFHVLPEDTSLDFIAYSGAVTRNRTLYNVAGMDIEAFKANPVVQLGHNFESNPIARASRIWKEGIMLRTTVEFDRSDHAQEIYRLYREGFMKGISVAVLPTADVERREIEDGPTIRYFPQSQLIHLALVPIPGDGAVVQPPHRRL